MDDRIEDDDKDKESLAGLSSLPPHRKAHSYSQQLRGTSTHKRHHQVRKHSLDDDRMPNNIKSFYDSDSDDDFFPRSSTNPVTDEHIEGRGGDDLSQYQPLQEFIGSGGGTGIFKAPIKS